MSSILGLLSVATMSVMYATTLLSEVHAFGGAHSIKSAIVDKASINTNKGEKVTITYVTQTSGPETTINIIIMDFIGNEILRPVQNELSGTGRRTQSYTWDGRKEDGEFFSGRAKIEIQLKDIGITRGKVLYVQVEGSAAPMQMGDTCAGYSDVPSAHKYCSAIMFMKNKGVITGDAGKGTFRPSDSLNRAETAKIIAETFKQTQDPNANISGNLGHPDIQPGAWYVKYIYIAKKYGVLKGDPSGTMRPGDNVNRAEFAVMFFRAAKKDINQYRSISEFIDTDDSAWYVTEANAAKGYGLIDVGTVFEGSKAMTRAEVAEWVFRFQQKNLWENSTHI